MEKPIVHSHHGVTLVGGAPVSRAALDGALALAPTLVAADGGANRLLSLGHAPAAVIGDFDSVSAAARVAFAGQLHEVSEQETTDFDKSLRLVDAPFVLALGFSGARADHGLAVLNTLVRHPARRCLILGGRDVMFLAPHVITLRLPVGSRLSLFPLAPVTGESEGLRWPIGGIGFAPDGRIGTSNVVIAPLVRLRFAAPRMLVILPRGRVGAVLDALLPDWRVR